MSNCDPSGCSVTANPLLGMTLGSMVGKSGGCRAVALFLEDQDRGEMLEMTYSRQLHLYAPHQRIIYRDKSGCESFNLDDTLTDGHGSMWRIPVVLPHVVGKDPTQPASE